MRAYLLVVVVTALSCALLTPLMRRVGVAAAVYTPVRQRDMHREPVPKLGGVAMAAAALIGLAVAGTIPFFGGIFTDLPAVRGLLVATAIVLAVGMADDLWDLRWWAKLAGQCGAGLAVALGGIRIEAMPVGWIPVGNESAQVALTVFVVVLTMNAINFVDGLDGLATGVALIGGSAFFVYSYLLTRTIDQFDYANLATLLMALLIGACVGFLPYNRFPARIFMGEVGALLIGLLMAAAAVAVTADLSALDGYRFRNVPAYMPILLPLAVLALPFVDLLLAVLRRTARGRSPFTADRGHLHHKLVDGGYTHPQAVWLLWLWAFLVAWGVVALNFVDDVILLPLLALCLAGASWLSLRPPARRGRRRWENRAGWWGILWWSLGVSAVALGVAALVCGGSLGPDAAASALLGGGIVLGLSALTGLTTALAWDHAREAALPLSIGMFVLKLAAFALLLGEVPPPAWVQTTPAALAALTVIVVWQGAEVLVFARTRRSLYAD